MYVCICKAISDKDILDAVHNGAEDIDSVQAELGAGTVCGGCREFTEHLINETVATKLTYAA